MGSPRNTASPRSGVSARAFLLVGTALFPTILAAAGAAGVRTLRLSFEGNGAAVHSQDGRVVGTFMENATKDGQVVYDKAYHVPGKTGSALHFVREGHTHVKTRNRLFTTPVSKLAASVFVRSTLEHTGTLLGHDIDSAKDGFSLFIRKEGIRFRYGDGKANYVTTSSPVSWADGEWHQVEAVFDAGTVKLFFDGRACARTTTAGVRIAPPSQNLHIGTYPLPGRGRAMYSFEGEMDEIVLATSREEVAALLGRPPYEPPDTSKVAGLINAVCKPVDSTEQHFGKPVFHTFRGRPVPLSFMLRPGKAKGEVEQSALVFYLPSSVQIVDVFQPYRNSPYAVVKTNRSTVTRDGIEQQRIETVWDTYPKHVVIGVDTPADAPSRANLEWAIKVNGIEFGHRSIELRFLEPTPVPASPGRFTVGLYMMGEDMTFSTPDLQRRVADLYLSSGIRRKGLHYQTSDPRGAFDRYLRERGFLMHNMSMWHGPLGQSAEKSGFPPAVSVTGKPLSKVCPSVLWRDDFKTHYRKVVANALAGTQDGDWVLFDYEPWSAPAKECFCPICLARFRKAYNVPENATPRTILSKHRKAWVNHWLDIYEQVIAVWVDAVHAHNPTLKTGEYTYTYDYTRGFAAFWGCPKDPRRVEKYLDAHMLRLYYRHGRAAFDGIETMIQNHKLPVCVISMVSDNPQSKESLPPQLLYEKMVLSAALGVQDFYLWPDKWIDGGYHQAIGRACRDIWRVEEYYYQGKRSTERIEIRRPNGKLPPQDYASTVWEKDGKKLLTVVNCTGREQTWDVALKDPVSRATGVAAGTGIPIRDGILAITIKPHSAAFVVLQ